MSCLLNLGSDLFLPFNLHVAEKIGHLAGGAFPQSRRGIWQIRIATGSRRAFPCFSLFAFDFDCHIRRCTAFTPDLVSQFAHPAGDKLGKRRSINSSLVCEGDCVNAQGLNLIQQRFLFWSCESTTK